VHAGKTDARTRILDTYLLHVCVRTGAAVILCLAVGAFFYPRRRKMTFLIHFHRSVGNVLILAVYCTCNMVMKGV
jgi:hypothetical protein